MSSYMLEEVATEQNFDESAYLLANPDVANAVKNGHLQSGLQHFNVFGKNEGRRLRMAFDKKPGLLEAKARKLERIKPLLRKDMPYEQRQGYYDFLTEELRSQFNITDTDAVSSHDYGACVMDLVTLNEHGLILDCGAGRRATYFDNIVNFEIVDYETTDVRGVGEVLPFVDESFDAVISMAVLEHVKDPFLCAKEISRVLRPGGQLICCVPFLQPLHGYPHHYYNMTGQGLTNLFDKFVDIDRIDVLDSVLPIWTLTWILRSWADGLKGETRNEFLALKVSDLMESGDKYLERSFVRDLSLKKNLELASATVLFAHKKQL